MHDASLFDTNNMLLDTVRGGRAGFIASSASIAEPPLKATFEFVDSVSVLWTTG